VQPLRIGVLGAARIAELAIVGPARATGHRLVAIAARDRSRAEAFAARHGVERVLDSYADVVTNPEVEVVQPSGQRPARPLEPGRGGRRQARADGEAVRQQRRGQQWRQREERVVTSRWAGRTAIPLRYCSPHGTVLSCTTSSGSILVICWYLLDGNCDYHDLGGDFFIRRDSDRALQRAVAQLQALGYHITLQPAA
jgi:hypothetical protein